MKRPVHPEAFRSRASGRDEASVQSIGRAGPFLRVIALATTLSLGLVVLVYPQDASDRIRPAAEPALHRGDKIGPGVRETLESEGSVRVIVALETPASLKRPTRSRFDEIRRDIGNAQNAVIGALTANEHSMRRRYGMVPAFAARIQTQAALDRLAGHPLVVKIDLDAQMAAHLAESVPHIRADSMHAHGYTGEGVVVAILDTGIDTDHPDLSDDLIHEECFLSGPYCSNGSNRQSGPGSAEDDNGHGTHVTGTITSAGIVSGVGVAPDAQIIAIRILDFRGSGWASDIIAGLDWILDNRPDVDLINMSLGSGYHETECDLANAVTTGFSVVVNALRAVGVTTFASSGNDYSDTAMGLPACVSGVISVGATDDSDDVADFSNTNAYTDLLAPGVEIVADAPGGAVASKDGTSMASPHAVGCAALQIEAGWANTPGSLEAWLKGSGVAVTDARNGLTFPRIDCFTEPVYPPSGPANDNLADATAVGPLPYSSSGSTLDAGNEPSEAFGACSSDHGNSIWWSFTAVVGGRYEVNTNGSSINTGLSVWSGPDHPLDGVGCDDDSGIGTASRLRFDAMAGQEYFIRVIGFAGEGGSVVINVLVPTLPPNDDVTEATPIGSLPTTVYGSNVDASLEPSEQLASCASDAGTAVWWVSTAAETGPVYVDTEGSDFDTVLGIWTGAGHPMEEIACNNDFGPDPWSWLFFEAISGESYYIRVSGNGGAEGDIVLNATMTDFDCTVQTDIPVEECQALVELFNYTDGPSWEFNSGWKTTNAPCSWGGITCSGGHVSRISLGQNKLAGAIPESIENLSHLKSLRLFYNILDGSIPESLGSISTLEEINLEGNHLTGPIPESLGTLSNLTDLWLAYNYLSGDIPASIGNLSSLRFLLLHHNFLTGPIPETIGNLSSLTFLDFNDNDLTGSIPESVGELSELTHIDLGYNSLSGPIPKAMGKLSDLTALRLHYNVLTGPIPEELGSLHSLTVILLQDNSLEGTLPPTLGSPSNLATLILRSNKLQGTVPLPIPFLLSGTFDVCDLSDNDPGLCVPDLPEYRALARDGRVCDLPLDPNCPPIIHAEAKVFLEGPYSGAAMQARPAFTDHCPSLQPYSDPVFDGTPLDYDAPDVATSPPDSVLDWLLVSLRQDVTPESEAPGSQRTAFLRTNGTIVDTSGTILAFPGVAPGAYRLVVRHRNHASVMSADTLDLSDGLGSWDFTTAMTQAYSASGSPMKQLPDGRFGMFACDANVDGQITAPDFNLWNAKTTAGATGYEQADCNLDGQVTAPDFNLWNANTTAGATSQVPD